MDSPVEEVGSNFWSLEQSSSAMLSPDARAGHIRHVSVEPRGPTSPASIASTEVSAAPHIQWRGARMCP